MFLMLRPEKGYMQMIEYIIHSPENITSHNNTFDNLPQTCEYKH